MCGGRSIRSDIAFVEIVICRRQNALKERLVNKITYICGLGAKFGYERV